MFVTKRLDKRRFEINHSLLEPADALQAPFGETLIILASNSCHENESDPDIAFARRLFFISSRSFRVHDVTLGVIVESIEKILYQWGKLKATFSNIE